MKLIYIVLLAAVTLAGCKDAPPPPGATKSAAAPVSTAAIDAEAKGFTVGSAMSANTVYVFFDPQCPHCAALWQSAKPLRTRAKWVWIPVGIMNASSTAQGATLLAAKDPSAAMDEHEASMSAKKGGIAAAGDIEAQKAHVAANTALMTRFGFASIPTIVGKHAETGALVTREGGLGTPELAKLLGLPAAAP